MNENIEITERRQESLEHRPVKGESGQFEAEVNLLRAENQFNDLAAGPDQGLERLVQAAAQSEHPQDTVNEALGRFQVFERLSDIQKQARRALGKLKRTVAFGMVGMSMWQGAPPERREPQTPETKTEIKTVSEQNIRERLFQDIAERSFVIPGGKSEILELLDAGKPAHTFVRFEDVDSLTKDTSEIETAHTHPLEVYKELGYGPGDIEAIKKGERSPGPMPPSFADIMGGIKFERYYQQKGKKISDRVYDPTGVWSYDIDLSHKTIADIEKFQEEIFTGIKNLLTEDDINLMKAKGFDDADYRKFFELLKNNQDLKSISDKFETFMEDAEEKYAEKYGDSLDAAGEIGLLAAKIAGSGTASRKPGEVDELISEYIARCAQNGIEVSYRAYGP